MTASSRRLRVFVAENPKAFLPSVFAEAPGRIGIEDSKGRAWVDLESGQRSTVASKDSMPGDATAVARARGPGMIGHAPPPSPSTERWSHAIEGRAHRADSAGDTVLAHVVRGPNEVRSVWWLHGDQSTRIRDRLSAGIRVELLGPDFALLLDPAKRRLELLQRGSEEVLIIPLPEFLTEDLARRDVHGPHRILTVSHDRAIIAIVGQRRVLWVSTRALIDVTSSGAGELEWAPTRILIPELEHLPALTATRVMTQAEHISTEPVTIPAATRRAVEALVKEGKLGGLTEPLFEALVEGLPEAGLMNVLRQYYSDPLAGAERAATDGFVMLGRTTTPDALLTALGSFLPDGCSVSTAEDVIVACNRRFKEAGDARRFLAIDSASDDSVFILVELSAARRLDDAGVPVFGV
ncbi:MAG: hypothetical protein HYV07_11530 [Deltaproteobacteria bacterium]|nr:hypothetical protein [Deltaproteobacteria bacterium]